MSKVFNIYCDESCHLEKDGHGVMVLGSVWCPKDKVRDISTRLREIKNRHGFNRAFEMKWTKLSETKRQFYLDVLDYFFDDDDLHLRAVVVPDKAKLNHGIRQQTHDEWYYKMYFTMLKQILDPKSVYNIYLDIKDTKSAKKEQALLRVLRNSVSDFESKVVKRLQSVRSHEIEIVQLTDLLIGAIGYANRGLDSSKTKLAFIQRFQRRSHRSLRVTTLPLETKVNLLIWRAREDENV